MKNMQDSSIRPTLRRLVLALAVAALSSQVATATPYASCLTNNGTTIFFRLNEAADDVKLVYSSDTVTNDLGARPAGLNSTNVTLTGVFKIIATKAGSPGIYQIGNVGIGTNVPANSPRGLAVVGRASDPNFGRVYLANSAVGTKPDGISALYSDLSTNFLGHVPTNYTSPTIPATYPFVAAGASSPMHMTIGPDGKLYICDWSDYFGNLIVTDPDAYQYNFALKQLSATNAAVNPVGTINNHGSVQSVAVQGSTSGNNMIIYTVDEDYQQDPTSTTLNQMNSLWKYEVGSGPLPYTGVPKLMLTPAIAYLSQTYNTVSVAPNGYIYYNQRRETASGPPGSGSWDPSLFILNPNMYIDPTNWAALYDPTNLPGVPNPDIGGLYTVCSNYWSHPTHGGFIWDSQSASSDVGSGGADYMNALAANSVSPDGNWLAGITYYNTIFMIPLTNGIPDLTRFTSLVLGGTVAGRDIAWDPANNFYMVSSGLGQLRYYSLGLTATAITSSDGTFNLVVPASTVGVVATTTNAYEQGTVPGVFKLTRTGGTGFPLPVNIAITGTAGRGTATGYVLKTNNVTFTGNVVTIPKNTNSLEVYVVPVDDTVPEPTQTAILTIAASGTYNVDITGPSATVSIIDNDTPQLRILSMDGMYEGNPFDYARIRIQRWGDTNVQLVLDTTNFTFTGMAVSNVDYYLTNLPLTMEPGVVAQTLAIIYPINNSAVDGNRTINLTMLAGTGFTVISNTASATIVDDDDPPETLLWSDNLYTNSSANWTQFFATTNGGADDWIVNWEYDYSGILIPAAPHSGADTRGLFMTVNKNDAMPGAAALNFYPNDQSFNGNYAFRFDMFLTVNNLAGTTEYALFGINHSGTKTNWFRNSTTSYAGVDPVGWSFDGVFYDVESDGAALGDYVGYSSPTTASLNPTPISAGRSASTLTGVFKSPPWTVGAVGGGAAANDYGGTTPSWASVELKQVNGVIYWSINHTLIFAYTNTTGYTSGNIMLGYCDAYDSVGSSGGSVIYANARLVSLQIPVIKNIVDNAGSLEITFEANAGDVPAQFVLQQSAPLATGPYADTSSTITSLGGGYFKAVKAVGASPTFYRIRRIE
jgi:hypothetical protein